MVGIKAGERLALPWTRHIGLHPHKLICHDGLMKSPSASDFLHRKHVPSVARTFNLACDPTIRQPNSYKDLSSM